MFSSCFLYRLLSCLCGGHFTHFNRYCWCSADRCRSHQYWSFGRAPHLLQQGPFLVANWHYWSKRDYTLLDGAARSCLLGFPGLLYYAAAREYYMILGFRKSQHQPCFDYLRYPLPGRKCLPNRCTGTRGERNMTVPSARSDRDFTYAVTQMDF